MGEVSVSEALEEFRERLLRWDELCAQLRELYYRYLDLAAFRSEKCYFPGRKCKRPWKREYDAGDLTLMWTYILNTAPLCGKLMRALAEVEYKIRKRALESLEKYGGVEERRKPNGRYEIVHLNLNKPVYGYLALWSDRLYVIWGEFDDLPRNNQLKGAEIERRVINIIERYKRGEKVEVEMEEYEVNREYERLWFEVPLSGDVSKLLGRMDRVPIALLRNLGWLLSDDGRAEPVHGSNNPGQVAMRILDWIAVIVYAKRTLSSSPLVFKLIAPSVTLAKRGVNVHIVVRAIGTAGEVIKTVYAQIGITLGDSEKIIVRGYAILRALKERAFRRYGKMYVVDNVGAWIAFSATVTTLVLGDGNILPISLRVATKISVDVTFDGKIVGIKELAKALGGSAQGAIVHLLSWHMRLLLPPPPTPAFEKTVKFYDTLTNYPAAVAVEIGGATYLLCHEGFGQFTIGRGKAAELLKFVRQIGLDMRPKKNLLVLSYTRVKELAKHVPVRFLNDLEREVFREVKPAPSPDLEALRRVLEEVVKIARIITAQRRNRNYIRIIPNDKSKLSEIAAMLKTAGIRLSIHRTERYIVIEEQNSVEAILKVLPYIFPPT